jgi:hypothetical protein
MAEQTVTFEVGNRVKVRGHAMARHRRLWKTFFFDDATDHELQSLWHNTPKQNHHVMVFDAPGFVETNLPYAELRAMFRMLDKQMPDHVTDTKPSWSEDDES